MHLLNEAKKHGEARSTESDTEILLGLGSGTLQTTPNSTTHRLWIG